MEDAIRINGTLENNVIRKALHGVDPNYDTPQKRLCMIEIAKRDGMCCTYCNKHLHFRWMVKSSRRKQIRQFLATYEHIKPESHGGQITVENGELACPSCNVRRGNQPVELFRTRLAAGYYTKAEKTKRANIRLEKKINKRFVRMKRKMKREHAEHCAGVLRNQGVKAFAVKYMVLLAHRVKMRNRRNILVSELFPM